MKVLLASLFIVFLIFIWHRLTRDNESWDLIDTEENSKEE